jgi:hypothetical protein
MKEVREIYYEVYFDGTPQYEGNYEDCRDIALHALDDYCAEVYKVTITEEKVTI